MKIGFWNRLAIVLIGLAVLVAPVAMQYRLAAEQTEVQQNLFGLCFDAATKKMERAIQRQEPETFEADVEACRKSWERAAETYRPFSWPVWFDLAGATLAFSIALYLLIWVGSLIGKWVLRGRDFKADKGVRHKPSPKEVQGER